MPSELLLWSIFTSTSYPGEGRQHNAALVQAGVVANDGEWLIFRLRDSTYTLAKPKSPFSVSCATVTALIRETGYATLLPFSIHGWTTEYHRLSSWHELRTSQLVPIAGYLERYG